MDRALRNYYYAVFTGIGAMSADALYLSLILFGMIHILQDGIISDLLAFVSAMFIFFLAYRIFSDRNSHLSSSFREEGRVNFYWFIRKVFFLHC
jgi:threonine/homoserine/homoserine lactone efflux protein